MDSVISRRMRADPQVIYELAAAVEDWPHILPHYRWVRVLRDEGGGRRVVEMAARRDLVGGLGIPVRWSAIQTLHPADRRIEFEHVRGVTRGMQVAWSLAPHGDVVSVSIRHVFNPGWRLVPDPLIRLIVGEFFVHGIAGRTLGCIGDIAERRARA
jgi:aromatase